jgi:hypothetical protein
VVDAADALSAATGIPITLEHCHITAAGEVHLSREGRGTRGTMSSLQLLAALLEGQASPNDLRILAVTVDPHCQGRHAGTRRLRVDVHWCLSRNPQADVARLAARALAVHPEAAEELPLQPAESRPPIPPIVERRPNVPSQPENTHRRPAVAVRVQRVTPGVALALAAVLLAALGGGAAAADALLVGDRSSLARDGSSRAPVTEVRNIDVPERRGLQPRSGRALSLEPETLPILVTR